MPSAAPQVFTAYNRGRRAYKFDKGGPVPEPPPAPTREQIGTALQQAGQYGGGSAVLTPESAQAAGLDPSKGFISPQFVASQTTAPPARTVTPEEPKFPSMAPGLGTRGGAPVAQPEPEKAYVPPGAKPVQDSDDDKSVPKAYIPPGATPVKEAGTNGSKSVPKAYIPPGATPVTTAPTPQGPTTTEQPPALLAVPTPTPQGPTTTEQPPTQQTPLVVPAPTPESPTKVDPHALVQNLIAQGHSPGEAQAIAAGQQPKTLSGAQPKPSPPSQQPQAQAQPQAQETPLPQEPALPLTQDDKVVATQIDKQLGGLLKGQGSIYVAMGKKYGVDPRLLAAISMEETGNGTSHLLKTRNNVGGITGPGHTGVGGDYMPYASIGEGIEAEASLIRHGYIGQGLDTIEKIGRKWAPPGAANDPSGTNQEWPGAVAKYYALLGGAGKLGEISGKYPAFAGSTAKGDVAAGGPGAGSSASPPYNQPWFSVPASSGSPASIGGGIPDERSPGVGLSGTVPQQVREEGGGPALSFYPGWLGRGGGAAPASQQPEPEAAQPSPLVSSPMISALMARGFTAEEAMRFATGSQLTAPGRGVPALQRGQQGQAPPAPTSAPPQLGQQLALPPPAPSVAMPSAKAPEGQQALLQKQPEIKPGKVPPIVPPKKTVAPVVPPTVTKTQKQTPSPPPSPAAPPAKVAEQPPAAAPAPTAEAASHNMRPLGYRAAVKLSNGEIFSGGDHESALNNARENGSIRVSDATTNFGFVDKKKNFVSMDEADRILEHHLSSGQAPAAEPERRLAEEPAPYELPAGSTRGKANPGVTPGQKLPDAIKEHASLVSPDDPRVRKQADGKIKGEHFVEGDPIHDQLLEGLPGGKAGLERQMLGEAEKAIADDKAMHISYLSALKEAQKYPNRESRTLQYEAHTPEARLMGAKEGQVVEGQVAGHSFMPVAVGIKAPKKGEPHQSYIDGISTSVLANNFQHLSDKLTSLGIKTPYKSLGEKLYNDIRGYYSNLNAGHTGTGRGYALGTEDLPNEPDTEHVPYKLTRNEADFINMLLKHTGAFAKHEDAQKLRELARANGTLITEAGETNRMRHNVEQADPGWWQRVLEPSIRTFTTGLIVASHANEEHMPEGIRPGKEYQQITRAIQDTRAQGRPNVPIAVSLHHTYADNKAINKIEREFSEHRIDEAEARRQLHELGEDPEEYRFVGGSGGLVTPYEDDPEALTPEEHTQMKNNLRDQWVNGKLDTERYRQKAAEVPLPSKPSKPPVQQPEQTSDAPTPTPKPEPAAPEAPQASLRKSFNMSKTAPISEKTEPEAPEEPEPGTPVDPSKESISAHPDYLYHATNIENVDEIKRSQKLNVHRPDYGTEQNTWPDGSTEKRSYWTHDPQIAKSFYPMEGEPALLRAKRDSAEFKRERTGDHYLRKPLHAKHLEHYKGEGQWAPLIARPKAPKEPPAAPQEEPEPSGKGGAPAVKTKAAKAAPPAAEKDLLEQIAKLESAGELLTKHGPKNFRKLLKTQIPKGELEQEYGIKLPGAPGKIIKAIELLTPEKSQPVQRFQEGGPVMRAQLAGVVPRAQLVNNAPPAAPNGNSFTPEETGQVPSYTPFTGKSAPIKIDQDKTLPDWRNNPINKASIRYNNPGAQARGDIANKYGSSRYGTPGGFEMAYFDSPVQGAAAQFDLLANGRNFKGKSIKDLITNWGKPGEDLSDYVDKVTKATGVSSDFVPDIKFWQSPAGLNFVKAQARYEAGLHEGQDYPGLLDEDWQTAQRMAFPQTQ